MSKNARKKKSGKKGKKKPFPILAIVLPSLAVCMSLAIYFAIRLGVVYLAVSPLPPWDQGKIPELLNSLKTDAPFNKGLEMVEADQGADARLGLISAPKAARDLVAADPYVLIYDQRHAQTLPATIDELLDPQDRNSILHLAVAGNEDQDLAAFFLYLADELFPASEANLVEDYLRTEPDEDMLLPGPIEDLAIKINQLRQQGLLAPNWHNWDRIALNQALTNGSVRFAIAPRSFLKEMSAAERFFLRFERLPSGTARLQYAVIGQALEVLEGGAINSSQAAQLQALLRSNNFQHGLEESSFWTTVNSTPPYIDIEHRDAQRIVQSASSFIPVQSTYISAQIRTRIR